jgi:hypothetical protein
MRAMLIGSVVLSFGLLCVAQNRQPPSPLTPPTQQTSEGHKPPAAQADINGKRPHSPKVPGWNKPETGKVGTHETAIPVTTTKSAGVTTPVINTNNGAAQAPGVNTEGWTAPVNPRPTLGAPPNWEQAGQLPQEGDTNAAKAIEAEVGGAPGGGTLGVNNVMPNYDRKGAALQAPAKGAQGQAAKAKAAPKSPAKKPIS